MVDGPLPVANYRSTMKLEAAGEQRTKLLWSSTFDVPEGADAEQATKIVRTIYKGGIGGLQGRFGA